MPKIQPIGWRNGNDSLNIKTVRNEPFSRLFVLCRYDSFSAS